MFCCNQFTRTDQYPYGLRARGVAAPRAHVSVRRSIRIPRARLQIRKLFAMESMHDFATLTDEQITVVRNPCAPSGLSPPRRRLFRRAPRANDCFLFNKPAYARNRISCALRCTMRLKHAIARKHIKLDSFNRKHVSAVRPVRDAFREPPAWVRCRQPAARRAERGRARQSCTIDIDIPNATRDATRCAGDRIDSRMCGVQQTTRIL